MVAGGSYIALFLAWARTKDWPELNLHPSLWLLLRFIFSWETVAFSCPPRVSSDIVPDSPPAIKTNDYHDLCQRKLPNRKSAPGGRREKKSREWSGRKWPKGGIGTREVLATLGLLLHMGVVKLRRMEDRWSADPSYDSQMVRNRMPRDLFPMCCRFFHVADGVNGVEVVNSANDAEVDIAKLSKEYEEAQADRMHQVW